MLEQYTEISLIYPKLLKIDMLQNSSNLFTSQSDSNKCGIYGKVRNIRNKMT